MFQLLNNTDVARVNIKDDDNDEKKNYNIIMAGKDFELLWIRTGTSTGTVLLYYQVLLLLYSACTRYRFYSYPAVRGCMQMGAAVVVLLLDFQFDAHSIG